MDFPDLRIQTCAQEGEVGLDRYAGAGWSGIREIQGQLRYCREYAVTGRQGREAK